MSLSQDELQSDNDDLADYWTEDEEDEDGDVVEDDEPPQLVERALPESATSFLKDKDPSDITRKVTFADDKPVSESAVASTSETGGRYIPPALRRAQAAAGEAKSAERIKLERKLQGLLNKCVSDSFA